MNLSGFPTITKTIDQRRQARYRCGSDFAVRFQRLPPSAFVLQGPGAGRLLKNRVILTEGEAEDRVISEARHMWSHLLFPSPRESFPNTVLSLCCGPEHHDLIHGATMQPCRRDYPVSRYQ